MAGRRGELERIAVEGYLYLYPLVLMDLTRRLTTSVPADRIPGCGPANTFLHMRAFPRGDFTDVVRPNFDTLYSPAWLDLNDGPVVLSVSREVDRYFMLPLLDMWTDVFAVVGTRTTGGATGSYAIVPPGWRDELPGDLERIDAPTPWVWVLGRTQTNGPADYEAVHAVQDGFGIRPLVDRGPAPVPEAPDRDPSPMDQVGAMPGVEFFRRASTLLDVAPPHPTDQPVLARLHHLGIRPGRPFDPEAASPEVSAALAAAPVEALAHMRASIPRSAPVVDGWSMRRAGIGVYGTDYLYRAVVAMIGLGANLPEDAVYPMLVTDEHGEIPVGEHEYVLHFAADALPPVDAFWSLTMYDQTGFTVPNPLGRYALGDRDALHYNDDGSLDLAIASRSPGAGAEANWLPAPPGPLGLTLRLYAPRPEVLDGRWNPPPLLRA
ncbi:DUF1254 domain-containing protein [Agromyces sp. SYSU T00194]|uniref:DUF1254 domain-containing protein n=1 Tax=Agromyces chitinivorans TaxID=3158560 RepID=UPI003399E925